MKIMKYLIASLVIFVSLESSAGGGGGGGVIGAKMNLLKNQLGLSELEMAKYIGVDRSEIAFQYAHINSKSILSLETVKLRIEEISGVDSSMVKALEESKVTGSWSRVK